MTNTKMFKVTFMPIVIDFDQDDMEGLTPEEVEKAAWQLACEMISDSPEGYVNGVEVIEP